MTRHGIEYGADPSVLVVAGRSAGAHLAAMCALTLGEPAFQPGFEQADTSVTAALCLYVYHGERDRTSPLPSSPPAYLRADAPPFMSVHGDNDTPGDMSGDWAQCGTRLRPGSRRRR